MDKIKAFLNKLNERGIPIPLLRDPKVNGPSVSLTLMVISFLVVLIGLIGKYSKVLDIDVTQSIYWFTITAGLYFSRTIGSKYDANKKTIEITGDSKE